MPILVIPGLAEARAAEGFSRSIAFVEPFDLICGLRVKALTIWHILMLDCIQSPFVVKRADKMTAADILNALWILSADYEPSGLSRKWFWLRYCRKLNAVNVIEAIIKFIGDAFADCPPRSNGKTSYFSAAAGLVDLLASEYGWSEKEILQLPLKRAFQYRNAILYRLNKDAILWNPSDRVIGDWLNRNAESKEAN